MTRVIVATQNGGLDDQVSSIFGRCQTYTIVDAENNGIKNSEVVQNQYANARSGAGIQAAGFVTNQGAEVVIAGNFGPNVASVLNQSGVNMVSASGISVRDAVNKYLNGELESVSQATSAAKTGMGRGGGQGMGMGRGMRSQKTPQKQPGQSSSQGQRSQSAPSQKESQPSNGDEIEDIKKRLGKLEKQLNEITKGLDDLKKD